MAQHDYNLANQSGADFRADLNNALSAIATTNSGATSPSTTFAHQLWVDTANSVLKIRNSANDAWITTGVSITADNTFTGNITGNASTATALETARTINGASFDGTANISFDTDSVSEGSSNLYFTNARVESYLDAGTSTPTFASAVINSSLTGSAILDDDTFGTASATTVATSESIKAYVDSQVGSVDTLAEILSNGNTTGGTDIAFGDNDKAIFGTGNDLQIYHDGSHSYVADVGTGNLRLLGNDLRLQTASGNENYLKANLNGAVTLYHNNSAKLATTSTGIDVTGEVQADTHFTSSDLVVTLSTSGSGGSVYLRPNGQTQSSGQAVLDTSGNLDVTGTVTSDGLTVEGLSLASETTAFSTTANSSNVSLKIGNSDTTSGSGNYKGAIGFTRGDSNQIRSAIVGKQTASSNNVQGLAFLVHPNSVAGTLTEALLIKANNDIIFYDDTGTSENMVWDASADSLTFVDNAKATFGTDADLQIFHDGTNSHIRDQGTGDVLISASDKLIIRDTTDGAYIAVFDTDGAVSLNYGNSTKFETTSTGIDVTGTTTTDTLDVDNVKILSAQSSTVTDDVACLIYRTSGHASYANGDLIIQARSSASRDIYFLTGSTTPANRMQINGNGDISFYDDTGTTQGLFWDASTERLGIGTTSPNQFLDVSNTSGNANIVITASDTGTSSYTFGDSGGSFRGGMKYVHTDDQLFLRSNGGDKLSIDSSGSVGIGTTSPSSTLEVNAPANNGIKISSTAPYLYFNDTDTAHSYDGSISQSGTTLYVGGATPAQGIVFRNKASFGESARITTSGDLLVGKTGLGVNTTGLQFSGGLLAVTKDGGESLILNRKTTDGVIANFRKDNTSVGNTRTFGGDLIIQTGITGLRFNDANDAIHPVIVNGSVSDGATDLGLTNARFKDIYATNGTIQTSDINEKQDIEDISEAETRVAVAAKGLLKKYRWKSAVADKGDDARIHFGIMAQDLQQAFTAEGLDAGDYGMFISSTWTDETTGKEKTRLGVRYNELLAFIIAAI